MTEDEARQGRVAATENEARHGGISMMEDEAPDERVSQEAARQREAEASVLEHDSAAALLPWLVNGTLLGEERERVERHVRTCLPCRAELAEQTRLRTLVQREPVVHLSADAAFERLRGRLDRHAAQGRAMPGRMVWAAAAAVLIAGVGWLVAVALLGSPSIEPRFGTLSDGVEAGERPEAASVADDDMLVDVIFADGVRESEMRQLLDSLGAEIVAGPSRTLGRYTLRIGRPNGSAANDRESSDREASDRESSDREASDREANNRQASDAETSGAEASGAEASGAVSAGSPPAVDDVVRRLLDDERIRFAGPTFSLPAPPQGSSPDVRAPAAGGPPQPTPHSTDHDR